LKEGVSQSRRAFLILSAALACLSPGKTGLKSRLGARCTYLRSQVTINGALPLQWPVPALPMSACLLGKA
jgi:hypothetical protein